ncbi:hypothetical protein H4219_004226 [Mycoemilia scoparia]|uniref:O-methyltransferase n=1 Tax=Mycoemilia scoparia TaxID=417184 RepID=A0A9W8DRH3_9FUNG|nr:hypothetical protein H4219_004226 [Mycoemilia scoparia]
MIPDSKSASSYITAIGGGTKVETERSPASVKEMMDYSTFVSAPKEFTDDAKLEQRLAEIHKHGVDTFKYLGKALPIYPFQAYFLTWLMGFAKAKNVFEIGTFTGYSTIYLADALRKNGGGRRVELSGSSSSKPIITCELVDEVAKYAESNFVKAGVDDLIEVKVGKALDTIQALPKGTKFDFIFIDADKQSYTLYYKAIMDQELLSANGVMVFDNTMLARTEKLLGKEANPDYEINQKAIDTAQYEFKSELSGITATGTTSTTTNADNRCKKDDYTAEEINELVNEINQSLHAFNMYLKNDERVHQLNLPIFTGMTAIRLV